MKPLTPDSVLTAWERGRSRHPIDRALLLFALSEPDVAVDSLADQPLGRRNSALMRLRQATFGSRLRAYLDCAACGERQVIELDAFELLATGAPCGEGNDQISVDGRNFRLPTSRDLALIAVEADVDQAATKLLELCALDEISARQDSDTALSVLMDSVAAALEQADPLAELTLDFVCDSCGHAGTVPFDIATFLWEEVESQARRLFDEVHLLARAYGWNEAEILALSEARRSAYLERVTA
jgi:hypothetical protein